MAAPRQPGHANASYLATDTIAAISSALGGATALVRLSGPAADAVLERVVGRKAEAFPARVLTRAIIPGADDVLIARFVAPASYTGESLIEIHTHGGEWGVRRVLERLLAAGARQALPGEFSFRAVRNGKMTVNQAQAVADLIAASNDGALELALEKLGGSQNRLIGEIAESLRTLATLAEAGIDFSDQDIDEVSLPRLKERASALATRITQLREGYRRGERVQEGIRVALVGLPNAGKSSFFNALLGEERSIVSEVPGTTRDTVGERYTLRTGDQSFTLRLEDTAGLRKTSDAVEKMGIERTLAAAARADLVLFLVDMSAAESIRSWADEANRLIAEWRHSRQTPVVGVFTKSDRVAVSTPRPETLLRDLEWCVTSAQTGVGIDAAAQLIAKQCALLTARSPGEVLLTRLDQLAAVEAALECFSRAQMAPEMALFAADLRQALHALGRLIGETSADDILGRIFSEFCIGK